MHSRRALQDELKSAISAIVGPEVGLGWMGWSCFEYAKWLAEIFESLKSYSSCYVMIAGCCWDIL